MKKILFILFIFSIILFSATLIISLQDGQRVKSLRFLYLSYYYDRLAGKFGAGDYHALRYQAMSDALKQGKLEYKFETGPLPTAQ